MSERSLAKLVPWFVALPVALSGIAGCATNMGDEPMLADSESALDYEQTDWNEPFWERWVQEAREDTRASSASRTSRNNSGQVDSGLLNDAPETRPSSGLRPKLGIYIDSAQRDSLSSYQLVNALEAQAARHGLTLIEPDRLAEAIRQPEACTGNTPLACMQQLAIYPGIRALLVLNSQSAADGSTRVSTRMLDTDFGIEYQPMSARIEPGTMAATNKDEIAVWSDRILSVAHDRIAIAPWFTHSFAVDGDELYISAGRHSGLTAGDMLVVHDGGATVRSPGGQVVAWNPGAAVGRIEVKKLVGPHMAVARLKSGRMPTPEDKLTQAD